MTSESSPPNPLFKLVIVLSAVFILTILLMIVSALGSAESPLVQFFNDHGLKLIGIETGSLLFLIFAAMAVDRRQTLARLDLTEKNESGSSEPTGTSVENVSKRDAIEPVVDSPEITR